MDRRRVFLQEQGPKRLMRHNCPLSVFAHRSTLCLVCYCASSNANCFSKQKQKRQQTKEEQLYGVFAEDSDGEPETGRSRGRGAKTTVDLSKPVVFMSSGETVQPRKQEVEVDIRCEGASALAGNS
jgi:hypothetical protein